MSTPDSLPTDEVVGKGFAWAAAHRDWWVINMPCYGAFLFQGTRAEAEEMRTHKARWEGEAAHLRQASYTDIEYQGATVQPSQCWNHRGFVRAITKTLRGKPRKRPILGVHFFCKCANCKDGWTFVDERRAA